MKFRYTFIIIILIIVFTILFIYSGEKQTDEEKQQICYDDCIQEGWENGEWIGYQYCNCYDIKINSSEKNRKTK